MERIEQIVNMVILPQTKGQMILYFMDMIGLSVSVSVTVCWITGLQEGLSIYIIILTALSLTVTLAVKIYNLFTKNDKNKKL